MSTYRALIAAIAGLVLVSCATQATQPQFDRMSDQELVEYNSGTPILENVYCREEVRSGSHIRKRYCATVAQLINGLQDEFNRLSVLNYGSPTSFGQ